jgi:subtilisin family serine protease
MHDYEQLYWQEQIHLASARSLFQNDNDNSNIGITVIAGKANLNHPALTEATGITQFDMRDQKVAQPPDDYTTAVAALLVGKSGEGRNYTGILPGANLSIFQVLSEKYVTTDSTLLAAIEAAIVSGNKIICLTLGGMPRSNAYERIFERAYGNGVIIVCAAGNLSSSKPLYPAAYPHSIAVGATDTLNYLSGFSNYGDWVTTFAPGENIPVAEGSKSYNMRNGTTFSCTIVAGVIALMLKANKSLTFDQIREILKATGTFGDANVKTGLKQINAFKAVQSALKTVKE